MKSLFRRTGVHCVVDGQFGSTGKGALCAWLADRAFNNIKNFNFAGAIYSGGPNSGHTSYYKDEKIVLKQLPTFAVQLSKHNLVIPIYLSAGAVIDRDILKKEVEEHEDLIVFVHPNAAILTDEDRKAEESGSIAEVAGTRSGTGAALIRKIQREPKAIAKNSLGHIANNIMLQQDRLKPEKYAYFMEVAQGFSLGINSQFYPKVTSRECTVMQGLADARIPTRHLARTYMAIRTYPIRVGNTDGFSSGDWYSDQHETTWDTLGVEPEITTVTKRIRRVASFSEEQYVEACLANDPDFVFISHMDYLSETAQTNFIERLESLNAKTDKTRHLMFGYGPRTEDIRCPS